jgi:N-dimethylarginine dimethylaminohydrolase
LAPGSGDSYARGMISSTLPAAEPLPLNLPARPSAPALTTGPGTGPRTARVRRFLMCRPTFFSVDYAINPWMDPTQPVDRARAVQQWEHLRDTYLALGHQVDLVEPLLGLPDMVFAANGALVVDGLVLGARFRDPERDAEAPAYREWFRRAGFPRVRVSRSVSEGEGDFLVTERFILAGTGFRTRPAAHREAQEFFGRPVVSLRLVDPRYYHLDTALAVLDDGGSGAGGSSSTGGTDADVAYYPGAFSAGSRAVIRRLFPNAIEATEHEAAVLGLNAVSDGRHVVLPAEAVGLAQRLRERGYQPVPVELSELRKAGGGPKCCTLEIRS